MANTEKLDAGTGIGLPINIPRSMGSSRADREMFIFLLVLALVTVIFLGSVLFLRSKAGFGLIAVRDGEGAAESVGVSPIRPRHPCSFEIRTVRSGRSLSQKHPALV